MRKTKLSDFEFRIFRMLEAIEGVRGSKILVACSGGLDSIALLSALHAMAAKLDLALAVVHVHHGRVMEPPEQGLMRDRACAVVTTEAQRLALDCEVIEAPANVLLISEESLRDFRLAELERVRKEKDFDFVALAHHADDLLETRLFRLIRGTGAQGLAAMTALDGVKLRPFLNETRNAIHTYADQNQLRWIDDPSNSDSSYFRNWLRNEWLPQLEGKRAGAVQSFARSLETLVKEVELGSAANENQFSSKEMALGKIDRAVFKNLALTRKRSIVANLTRSLGARDFSRSRVEEVIKRLHHLESTGQKVEHFVVGGVEWSISATQIQAKIQLQIQT